jgi:hypothetical protein
MPTALDLLGVRTGSEFDGISLAPELQAGPKAPPRLADRVRFTETGITMGFTKLGDAKVNEIVQQGMSAYAINPTNGRLELRREFFDDLMRSKERAAVGRTRLLSAVPLPDGSMGYVALPLGGGMPSFLSSPPDPQDDPELANLWLGLRARFGSELVPADPHS